MENKEYFSSINDVSRRLNVPAHTLRYWEKQFPTAIRPTTGAGGRRYYRAETVEKLATIADLLYNRGMTIAGVKKMMRAGEMPTATDTKPVATAQPQPIATPTPHNTERIDAALDLLNQALKVLK